MALELVTGYWGQEHVTAEQDADLNAGVVGSGMHVMPIGEKMRAEAVTSNKVRIFDGLFLGYGRQCVIEEGAYEDVEIENGTAGLLRNDMIVVRYAKDEVTGVEGVSFGVLKGQTGATVVDPVPNNQDIRSGAFESEMPLYRVKLNGLAIEAIQPLFAVPKSIAALTTALDDLNRNMNAPTILSTQNIPDITGVSTDSSLVVNGYHRVYKKSNGEVIYNGNIFVSVSNITDNVIATLPGSYRPVVDRIVQTYDYTNGEIVVLQAYANGTVRLTSPKFQSLTKNPKVMFSVVL